jgi:hypothetical protein
MQSQRGMTICPCNYSLDLVFAFYTFQNAFLGEDHLVFAH